MTKVGGSKVSQINEGQKEVLQGLLNRYANIRFLYNDIKSFDKWKETSKSDIYKIGAVFFKMSQYAMWRIMLIELNTLLQMKGKSSLRFWLSKAYDEAPNLKPSEYSPSAADEKRYLKVSEYRRIIRASIEDIESFDGLIDRIRHQRDKLIAHLDDEYFGKEDSIYFTNPINDTELKELIDAIYRIFRTHYSLLFSVDMSFVDSNIAGLYNLMRYAGAHYYFRKDVARSKPIKTPYQYEKMATDD